MDLKTLASALTSGSYNLRSMGEFLEVNTRKLDTEEHGGSLTPEYLEYALNDVQTTWECYCELMRRYRSHLLERTPAHRIMSEASLGKGYLREMGIRPWRQMQRDFPAEIIGRIMSAYYGGRSEVRIRRTPTRVLYCDFLSMYPTVCTLMGLWKFVIADRMDWRECTEETRAHLARIGISDLQRPLAWRELTTLVRIIPNADILPVRAPYEGAQKTIGLNYLSSDNSLWFTLADCIASKLLTGKAPQVIEAITFQAGKPQAGLQSICIGGNSQYEVAPAQVDFYRTVIDHRNGVKAQLKQAKRHCQLRSVKQLEAEQLALKILANATSYGIFVEINVEELDRRQPVACYAVDGTAFSVQTHKLEKPGTYFHPLLASLITGAARLMLAITERLAVDRGLDWAFCDTDSMALAKPVAMGDDEFVLAAEGVRRWFDRLNPYQVKDPLLKLEDANFGPNGELTPLYCFAVSAKRYALFNLDSSGRPVIRKASAHGLGHLRAPYIDDQAPTHIPAPTVALSEIGVDRWQRDLWYQIVSAALEGRPDRPDLDFHPALIQPAVSRYGATTPELLGWFKAHNASRPYHEQVRPFGFLTGLQVAPLAESSALCEPGRRPRRRAVHPIAPFSKAPAEAARRAFDRDTGEAISRGQLATYRSALAQYHLHPESKFLGGDYANRGHTRRRHVRVAGITYIGKEANRWEEQFFLGADPGADVSYGAAPPIGAEKLAAVADGIRELGQRRVAKAARMSLRDVSAAVQNPKRLSPGQINRLRQALASLRHESECSSES